MNQELGEIGGVFVSKQPSDTDMGAKEPKTVLLKGIFYGKVRIYVGGKGEESWELMRCKMERVGMKGKGGVRETCVGDQYHLLCSCDLPKFGLV